MRILHYACTLKGGIASYLDELLPLQAQLYGAQALTLLGPQDHMGCLNEVAQVSARQVATGPLDRSWRGLLRDRRVLTDLLRREAFDVLHLHSTHAGLVGRSLRMSTPPIVYCPHGWAFAREPNRRMLSRPVVAMVERLLARRADGIVAISAHETRQAKAIGLPMAQLRTIPNGIGSSIASQPNTNTGPLRLLFIGRFDRQKGAELVADAMRHLSPEAYHLTMIGDQVVHATFDPTTCPSHVTVLPWMERQDALRAMAQADVVIMPSRWEGFGLVALEAMRTGRAVIASNRGNLPELIQDGQTGVVLKELTPTALAKAIRQRTRPQWIEMGQRGAAFAETHYRAEDMAQQLDALYADLLGRCPANDMARTATPIKGMQTKT